MIFTLNSNFCRKQLRPVACGNTGTVCFLWRSWTIIQGEHKNTPSFQVVIKSKPTGIFLQNWWLQLHKIIQFHVASHTLNVSPSCYSANIDAII